MRIINEFQYYNKTFKAGELTVWDYYIFIRDPQYAIQKVLSEFNETPPKLEQKHLTRFLRILFDTKDDDLIDRLAGKKPKTNPLLEKDFHIMVGAFARITNLDPSNMPLRTFLQMRNDIRIIWWTVEYDAKRNDERLDSDWLRKEFGDKNYL